MWKQDKHITMGLFGGLLSLILFIISCIVIGNKSPLVNIFLLCLTIFFIGYFFDGIRLGISFFVGIIAVLLIAFLFGSFGNYLVSNGYVTENSRKFFGSIFVPVLMFLAYLFWKVRAMKLNITDDSQAQEDMEDQGKEFLLDGTFIILIKPNAFKVDMVYKVFEKDGSLFFCRVGGQFYEINELIFELTPDKDETQLLSEKDNFKIEVNDINSITVSKKKSKWTGAIPNNGIIELTLDSKKEKYIIHPVIEYDYLIDYLKNTGIQFTEKR